MDEKSENLCKRQAYLMKRIDWMSKEDFNIKGIEMKPNQELAFSKYVYIEDAYDNVIKIRLD